MRAGITFVAIPPSICVTLSTSRKTRPSISTSCGSMDARREPRDGAHDRVVAEPRPRGVRARPTEHELRVEVAETSGLDRVVRRLEHHDEIGVEAVPLEEGRQRALACGQLLAPEVEVAERRARAREFEHHRDAALHVRRAEADDPSVLDPPGEVVLSRNGVVVAREHDAAGVVEDGVVVVGRRAGHETRTCSTIASSPRLGDSMFTSSSVLEASDSTAFQHTDWTAYPLRVTNGPPPTDLERGLVVAVFAPGTDDAEELAEMDRLAPCRGVEPIGSVVQHARAAGDAHLRRQGQGRGAEETFGASARSR